MVSNVGLALPRNEYCLFESRTDQCSTESASFVLSP
jgi:hypothetical protein